MRKERIKSLVLVALILSSLLLTGQIWFNEKLWPDGYNFFVSMRMFAFGQQDNNSNAAELAPKSVMQTLTQPRHLVAYFGNNGFILTAQSERYADVYNYVAETLKTIFPKGIKSPLRVTEAEWQKALSTGGLYIDYGFACKSAAFAAFLGVSDAAPSDTVGTMRRFIITSADAPAGDAYVYLRDEGSGNFYRISVGSAKEALDSALAGLSGYATPKNRFSFFLGTDTPSLNLGAAVFSSYLILSEEGQFLPTVKSDSPTVRDGAVRTSAQGLNRLLRTFDMNPNTVQKYTDANENIVFVTNNATLEISPNGTVDYRAVSSKGLRLSEAAALAGAYHGLIPALGLAEKTVYLFANREDTGLCVSGLAENGNTLSISLDYKCLGTPVIFTGAFAGRHAVSLEVEDGYLRSYTQIIRTYTQQEQQSWVLSTYKAADTLFDRLTEDQRRNAIEDMVVAYDDDGSNAEKSAAWFIKLAGESVFMR